MTALPIARADVEHVVVDGEVVVYDERDGTLHHLNATATLVWQCCDGRGAVDDLVGELADAYGAPRERIASDVHALLGDLRRRGLLRD
jgi:PqqD family protein of HPr-rel-A system